MMTDELLDEKKLSIFKKYRPEIMNIICFILIWFLYQKTAEQERQKTEYLINDRAVLILKVDENVRVNKLSNELLLEIKGVLTQINTNQKNTNDGK